MTISSKLDTCAARVDALSSRFDRFARRRADAVDNSKEAIAARFAARIGKNISSEQANKEAGQHMDVLTSFYEANNVPMNWRKRFALEINQKQSRLGWEWPEIFSFIKKRVGELKASNRKYYTAGEEGTTEKQYRSGN